MKYKKMFVGLIVLVVVIFIIATLARKAKKSVYTNNVVPINRDVLNNRM